MRFKFEQKNMKKNKKIILLNLLILNKLILKLIDIK